MTLRWTLLREVGVTRAVGIAEPSGSGQCDATVDLVGIDEAGRIASRGSTAVRPGFAPGSTPFEVSLVETGRETGYRVMARADPHTRPGR